MVNKLHQSLLRGGVSKLQHTAPPNAAIGSRPELPQPPRSASTGSSSNGDARPEVPGLEDKLTALGRRQEQILQQLGGAGAQPGAPPPSRASGGGIDANRGRSDHAGRDQLHSEVSGFAMHGGGWSAVVRFTDADFRHQLLGSKQKVVINRSGLTLRITRNRDSTATDEVYCSWGSSRRGRVGVADLRQFFSPRGAPAQQRRDCQPKSLPQKRPWVPGPQQAHGEGPGHRAPGHDGGDPAREGKRHGGSQWGGRGPGRGWPAHRRR